VRKLTDLIVATQMSTSFAFFCAIGAHLVATKANENWQFSVYVLLVIAVLFMLFPHIVTGDNDEPTN
jgi:Na+/phosphate symporter